MYVRGAEMDGQLTTTGVYRAVWGSGYPLRPGMEGGVGVLLDGKTPCGPQVALFKARREDIPADDRYALCNLVLYLKPQASANTYLEP